MNRSIERRNDGSNAFRAVTLITAIALLGCADPLAVQDPDIVTPESLSGEAGLQSIRNGALADFVVGYQGAGSVDGQVLISGLVADEWFHTGTFTSRAEMDQRQMATDNGSLRNAYLNLHQARVSLEDAAIRLEEDSQSPTTDDRIPEMHALAGYTYYAFGANYCNGVPFSRVSPTELIFGDPETNVQAWDRGIEQFDAALAHPAVTADQTNLARVGKARALMGKGDLAGAAAAVAGVPTDFAWYSEHAEVIANERNTIYSLTKDVGRWGIPEGPEGINGYPFTTANDPRVTWHLEVGGSFDTSFPDQNQYDNVESRSDPMRLATGIEARLVEAEKALVVDNDPTAWLAILNQLRADWTTLGLDVILNGDGSQPLPPLTDPGTLDGRIDMTMDERALWMYSQSMRLFDFRRLIRQYGRGAETVYPTGPYPKAGAYFTDIQLPIPEDEQNNPNFLMCINRDA